MVVSLRDRVRWTGVACACAVSLVAGLGLVFKLVTPESVGNLGTIELVGMLGLLVMPLVVGVCARSVGLPARRELPAAIGEVREIVVLAPDVRSVDARRHRRRVRGRASPAPFPAPSARAE